MGPFDPDSGHDELDLIPHEVPVTGPLGSRPNLALYYPTYILDDSRIVFAVSRMAENLGLYPRLGYIEAGRGTEDGFSRVYYRKKLK